MKRFTQCSMPWFILLLMQITGQIPTVQGQTLSAPSLLLPADMATFTTTEALSGILFRWSGVAQASGYQLNLSINGNYVFRRTNDVRLTLAFGSPPGSMVEWSVQAFSGTTLGPQSATRTLIIQADINATPSPTTTPTPTVTSTYDIPAAPTLLEPINGSRFHPQTFAQGITFRWSEVPGATKYQINRVVNSTPQPPVTTSQTSITLSMTVQFGDEVHWSVLAYSSQNIPGPNSDVWTILAEPAATATPTLPSGAILPAPELLQPANNASFSTATGGIADVTFSWSPVNGAVAYRFRIEEEGKTPVQIDLSVTSLPWSFIVNSTRLIAWTVTGIDSNGQPGSTSERRTIILSPLTGPTFTPTPTLLPTATITPTLSNRVLFVEHFDPGVLSDGRFATGPVQNFNTAFALELDIPDGMGTDGRGIGIIAGPGQGLVLYSTQEIILPADTTAVLRILCRTDAPGAQIALAGLNFPVDGQLAYTNPIGAAVPVNEYRELVLFYRPPSGRLLPYLQTVVPQDVSGPVTIYFDRLIVETLVEPFINETTVPLNPPGDFESGTENAFINIQSGDGQVEFADFGNDTSALLSIASNQLAANLAIVADDVFYPTAIIAEAKARVLIGNGGICMFVIANGAESLGLYTFNSTIGRQESLLRFGGIMEYPGSVPLLTVMQNAGPGVQCTLQIDDVTIKNVLLAQ